MQRVMSNLNVRVEKETKEQAAETLRNIGMDLSTAVNIFLKQLLIQGKIPFDIYTSYNQTTLNAIAEAKELEQSGNSPRFQSAKGMREYILAEED